MSDRLFHCCIALIILAATFGLSYSMGRYDQMQIDHFGLPAPALAAGTGLPSLSRMQACSPRVMPDAVVSNVPVGVMLADSTSGTSSSGRASSPATETSRCAHGGRGAQ